MTGYPQKQCTKCKECKDISNFGALSRSSDGLREQCKNCRRQYAQSLDKKKKNEKLKLWRTGQKSKNPNFYKEEYEKYKDGILKRRKKEYDTNKIDLLVKQRIRQNANRKYYRKLSKDWKVANIEHVRMYHSEWTKKNSNHVRIYNSFKRAEKRKAVIQIFTDEQLNDRMSMFDFKCVYCCGPFEHIDHVIPLSRGGKHCLANLKPACKFCNLSKHNKSVKDWIEGKK